MRTGILSYCSHNWYISPSTRFETTFACFVPIFCSIFRFWSKNNNANKPFHHKKENIIALSLLELIGESKCIVAERVAYFLKKKSVINSQKNDFPEFLCIIFSFLIRSKDFNVLYYRWFQNFNFFFSPFITV